MGEVEVGGGGVVEAEVGVGAEGGLLLRCTQKFSVLVRTGRG